MAENKKYLNLNGLSYTIRKIDNLKANIESPDFTGTPTINKEEIALKKDIPDNYVVNSDSTGNDISIFTDGLISLNYKNSFLIQDQHTGDTIFNVQKSSDGDILNEYIISGKSDFWSETEFDISSDGDIKLGAGGKVYYNDEEVATTAYVDNFLENLDPDTIGDELLKKKANIDSPVFTGTPTVPSPSQGDKSLRVANTKWVNDNYIGKQGDATINGTLTVTGSKFPLLTLKSINGNSNGQYLMNIQGNLMFGDCTSNNASRQYYGRMVPALNQAIVGAVSIGYNPKDSANYTSSKDYGIKFDVDVAGTGSATPSIIRQSGSFFVGVNGAYVGYSGSTSKPIDYDTQVYRVLDSNSIKTDEYIKSLEDRIAALEAKLEQLGGE